MKKDHLPISLSQFFFILYRPGVWVLLLSILLITACSSSAASEPVATQTGDLPDASPGLESPTPEPAPTATPFPKIEVVEPTATQGDTLPSGPVGPEPQFGEITFALDITEDNRPVEPNLIFTQGITEVHAIFDYRGMWPDYTWERVWYLNDREVSRTAGPWTGPKSGVFDYFIDNGGNPLPAGDWLLELFVDGELRSLGAFVIEEKVSAFPLLYTRCKGQHHNIYVADTEGHHEQLIVTRGAGPSWSPDGGFIFFFGEEGVDRQQRDGLEYVFDGISSGVVAVKAAPLPTRINQLNLFQHLEWKQGSARWANVAPNGSMIAYDAKLSGDYRIYFLGTEANQQFRYELVGEQADWSPDSRQLVYRSGRDGRTGLWISNRDDTGHRLLTSGGSDSFPAWSPDGQTIAFSRDVGGNVDIYAVAVDGSNLRRLTDAPGHDTLPAYAPNGDLIFRSARTGRWAIWKMQSDGSEQVEIIPDACVGDDWAHSRMDVLGN